MHATELLQKYDELDIANNPRTCNRVPVDKVRPGNPSNICLIQDTRPYVVCVKKDKFWAPARALKTSGGSKLYPISDKDILEFKVNQMHEYEKEVDKRQKFQKT